MPQAAATTGMRLVSATSRPRKPEGSLADLRLTRRGRWVLWSLGLVCVALAALVGGRALAGQPALPQEVAPRTIAQGETLWEIAKSVALPGEDVRDVVSLLVDLNGRSSVDLWAGEQILVPVR